MREIYLNWPILSIITYIPIIAALFMMLFIPKNRGKLIKIFTNVVVFVDFALSIPLYFYFMKGTYFFQFVERADWIPVIGVKYFVGMDGISIWLFLLTTFLGALSVLSSWSAITERLKEYYAFMLVLQTGMLGVFISLDMILFYVFWEVMLVPMYFLIGIWGGPRKLYAAIKFFLYTLLGSVLILLGFLALYFYHPLVHDACQPTTLIWHGKEVVLPAAEHGLQTWDITVFHQIAHHLPPDLQWWIFFGFFIGFAIKVPMFPFHTWLPDAHVEAPTAGSVILAGVLLKMGTYGFVRFSLPILPDATRQWVLPMVVLAIIGIIYGALVAMVQPDWKKLVAYSSVSHLGFCMLGMFALNPLGLQGSMLQMINHGLSTGALFLIVGIIYERRHTRMISEFSGLSKQMPAYATVFMIIMLSSIGLPGLNGFIGEFLVLNGAFNVNWVWAVLAGTGIVLGAGYMLWLYQRVMFGKLDKPENQQLKDLNVRELCYLLPIILFCVWIGLYPKPFLNTMEASINHLVEQVQPGYFEKPHVPPVIEDLDKPVAAESGRTGPAVTQVGGGMEKEQLTPLAADFPNRAELQSAGGGRR
jgi:NADH-quinone oxidoreductase subunit M